MKRIVNAFRYFWLALCGADLVRREEFERPALKAAEERKLLAEKSASLESEVNRLRQEAEGLKAGVAKHFQDGAVYTLLLLQREGRLVDFLKENIDGFSDDQVGAAVRQIHSECSKVLGENFGVSPVQTQTEGERIKVDDNFDPSVVKLTGAVPNQPPYEGVLRHQGWRAGKVHFPSRSGKIDATIIQAAEVEI